MRTLDVFNYTITDKYIILYACSYHENSVKTKPLFHMQSVNYYTAEKRFY